MEMTIRPGKLGGGLHMQPSKSHVHRLVLCAALAQGATRIDNAGHSQDIEAVVRAVGGLGLARAERDGDALRVLGGGGIPQGACADCGESATVLRLSLPLAMRGAEVVFRGAPGLMRRPMQIYQRLVSAQGGSWRQEGGRIAVCHALRGGTLELPGDVSSQFFSGLMLALPLLPEESELVSATPIESLPYLRLTQEVQALFGVHTQVGERRVRIPGGQRYRPADAVAEGDWSHAAFFIVAGALGRGVELSGLNGSSSQADRALLSILREAGGKAAMRGDVLSVEPSDIKPFRADVSQCPDLVPALCALALAARGTSLLENAARLRFKESDRLAALAEEFAKLGANIEQGEDWLAIHGTGSLAGGAADGRNDHRIAMALAVAGSLCRGPVSISGAQCVAKTAPAFFAELISLGGEVHGR